MKLLQEEFFGKIWKFINSINIFLIRWAAKLLFYAIILSVFVLVAWSVYVKNYTYIVIVAIILLIAEIAHFIRKKREKVMVERATDSKIKLEKSKNKGLLGMDPENKTPKNKDLLKNV
ncbi:hypothetical protein GOV14_03890 [Candidatus Pacearchaeota archaeon]|nr:hypothetical protein [Candidatus Pacearchaeota archaeon]